MESSTSPRSNGRSTSPEDAYDSGDPSAMGDDDDVRVQDETTETREELTGMVFEACRIGRVDIINESMERIRNGSYDRGGEKFGSNMTALVDGGGFTPLHVACAQGNVDCVRALLKYSHELIPAKAVNSDGRLAIECSEGNANVIRALCANLLQRIATGDEEGVFDLLEGGVDASIDDGGPDASSMLHWAASFGQSARMVRLLVEHGCSPNQQNKKGRRLFTKRQKVATKKLRGRS